MNKVILLGRLAADPEVRYTGTGKAVVEFTLAVDRGFGENKKTSFINCIAWEKRAETIGNTLTKGRKVLVEGPWAQQSWETTEGQKRRKEYCLVESFEYADSKKDDVSKGSGAADFGQFGRDVTEEEIPFS